MSQPNTPEDNSGAPREPRLAPRPLDRPAVDPVQAVAFGRPRGVEGAFDKLYAPASRNGSPIVARPPAPESLAEAFGRPPGAENVLLQRPDGDPGGRPVEQPEPPLWSSAGDPWRDPSAAAVLGGPALSPGGDEDEDEERQRGALLSLPEVLFGRRVKPVALGLLGAICLLIGAV
ncbi:serine protease, partial [Amycolatopsis rhizosphaerae]